MATALRADDVRKQIVTAFANIERPADDNLVDDDTALEAARIARYLEGRTWHEVDLHFLRSYGEHADSSAILSFLAPSAFRYFLPAFMLLLVDHYEDSDVLADTTISKLAPWRGPRDPELTRFFDVRHRGLNSQQRSAILSFLKFIKQEHGPDYVQDDLDRAIRHWEPLANQS